jgi:hypothetical protein
MAFSYGKATTSRTRCSKRKAPQRAGLPAPRKSRLLVLVLLAALLAATAATLLAALTRLLRLLAGLPVLTALLSALVGIALVRVALILLVALVRLILVLLVHLYAPWVITSQPKTTVLLGQRSTAFVLSKDTLVSNTGAYVGLLNPQCS